MNEEERRLVEIEAQERVLRRRRIIGILIWLAFLCILMLISVVYVSNLDLNIKKTIIMTNGIYYVFGFMGFVSVVVFIFHWYFQGVWSRFHTVINYIHALNLSSENIRDGVNLLVDKQVKQPLIEKNDKL